MRKTFVKEKVKFAKSDKVWVYWAFDWRKGRIREVFDDGTYLVRVIGYSLERMSTTDIQLRTNRGRK